MKILFICNQNQHRSKTAEELFRDRFETRSTGLYNETPVTEKELEWADTIIVMEDFQQTELSKRFPDTCLKKRILSLDIPDTYHHNQPELIDLLENKMQELLKSIPLTVS
ncbi:phosphotyrosine protein phosphatase [Nanoarchaeota archaeon]